MNRETKWMVTIKKIENYEWLRAMAADTEISGSAIIEELIEKAREDVSGDFKASLIKARARIRRDELEARKAEIESQLRNLDKKILSGGRSSRA